MRFYTKPLIENFQKDEPNKIDRKNQIKKLPFPLKIETWTWNRNPQIEIGGAIKLKAGEVPITKGNRERVLNDA